MTAGFLLDTNVLSELIRDNPSQEVLGWFSVQPDRLFYVSSITQAELLTGVALLPAGKRRDALSRAVAGLFEQDFAGRCLSFDSQAAERYASVRAQRQHAGRPISTEDAQIAAIALSAQMTLVTRNTRDFMAISGLQVLNPWLGH